MEGICSSEKSVNLYRITRHHIPEDSILRVRYIFVYGDLNFWYLNVKCYLSDNTNREARIYSVSSLITILIICYYGYYRYRALSQY
jgi:hypothetical protein